MTTKKITSASEIEKAKQVFLDAQRMLRAKDKEWMEEWNAAPNPFVAIKRYKTARNVRIRRSFIAERDKAQKIYETLTSKGANGKD